MPVWLSAHVRSCYFFACNKVRESATSFPGDKACRIQAEFIHGTPFVFKTAWISGPQKNLQKKRNR